METENKSIERLLTFVALCATAFSIYLVLIYIGVWDGQASKRGEFVEIIENNPETFDNRDTVTFIDHDGFVQKNMKYKIKTNKELEIPEISYDLISRFGGFGDIRSKELIQNIQVEIPSKEWLNRLDSK